MPTHQETTVIQATPVTPTRPGLGSALQLLCSTPAPVRSRAILLSYDEIFLKPISSFNTHPGRGQPTWGYSLLQPSKNDSSNFFQTNGPNPCSFTIPYPVSKQPSLQFCSIVFIPTACTKVPVHYFSVSRHCPVQATKRFFGLSSIHLSR